MKSALTRFEHAAERKLFQGTIPVFSDDKIEQSELNGIHRAIDREYDYARKALYALIDRRVSSRPPQLRNEPDGLVQSIAQPS